MHHLKPEAIDEDDLTDEFEELSLAETNPIVKLRKLALWIQKTPQR